MAIRSFQHRGLRQFHETGSTRRLPEQRQAARIREILDLLEAAAHPADMNLPGLVWHNLGPRQPHRWTVRVNGNWRITFAWSGADAIDVDIEDYH